MKSPCIQGTTFCNLPKRFLLITAQRVHWNSFRARGSGWRLAPSQTATNPPVSSSSVLSTDCSSFLAPRQSPFHSSHSPHPPSSFLPERYMHICTQVMHSVYEEYYRMLATDFADYRTFNLILSDHTWVFRFLENAQGS